LTNISDAGCGPKEVEVGGKKLLLHPLTFRDLAHLERWIKQQPINAAREAIRTYESSPSKPASEVEADKRAILTEAYTHSANLTLGTPESLGYMASFECALKLVWLSLRHNNKDLTEDQVEELIGTTDRLTELQREVAIISGLIEPELLSGDERKGEDGNRPLTQEPSTDSWLKDLVGDQPKSQT